MKINQFQYVTDARGVCVGGGAVHTKPMMYKADSLYIVVLKGRDKKTGKVEGFNIEFDTMQERDQYFKVMSK